MVEMRGGERENPVGVYFYDTPTSDPPPSRGRKNAEADYFMKIDCYYSVGCTSDVALEKNLTEAMAAEGVEAQVNYQRIDDEEAEKLGLKGSPTILIDGTDPFPSGITGFS